MKTTLQLIKEQCANYDVAMNDIKNHCCIREDCQCVYYHDENARCPYFEKSVLGIDKQLEAVYWAKIQAQSENRELSNQEIKEIKRLNKPDEKQTRTSSKFKKRFGSK